MNIVDKDQICVNKQNCSYLGEFTGLTTFFDLFPGTNKTVMPLKLSKIPLHTVLHNTCNKRNCLIF